MKVNYDKTIKQLEDQSTVEISVKVSPEEYARIWNQSAENYAKNITVPGFRKGFAPVKTIATQYEKEISERAFNNMVDSIVIDLIDQAEKKPISRVLIRIDEHEHTEEAHDHNLEFTFSYAYRTAPKLADVSKIKVERPSTNVNDEEIKQSLEILLKSLNNQKKTLDENYEEITEFTDDNVNLLAIPDVLTREDLENLVKSEVNKQKAYETEMNFRSKVLDEFVAQSEVMAPKLLVEEMVGQEESRFVERIKKLGLDVDKYIEEHKINLEELRAEWAKYAANDLARELVLSEYVIQNSIVPTEEEIDRESQNASPEMREKYTPENLREYVKYLIANNTAFTKILVEVMGEEESSSES